VTVMVMVMVSSSDKSVRNPMVNPSQIGKAESDSQLTSNLVLFGSPSGFVIGLFQNYYISFVHMSLEYNHI
jgi:hypothetical protein